jgi:hypothetical protein
VEEVEGQGKDRLDHKLKLLLVGQPYKHFHTLLHLFHTPERIEGYNLTRHALEEEQKHTHLRNKYKIREYLPIYLLHKHIQ